jgi:adenosylmethionine-8-amino-7-oxononanoate aminotransferase
VSRKQAYHGGTIGAMSISGMPGRKIPYDGITMPNVEFVGAADTFHRKEDMETEEKFVERLVKEIEEVLERVGPQNVVSFV